MRVQQGTPFEAPGGALVTQAALGGVRPEGHKNAGTNRLLGGRVTLLHSPLPGDAAPPPNVDPVAVARVALDRQNLPHHDSRS